MKTRSPIVRKLFAGLIALAALAALPAVHAADWSESFENTSVSNRAVSSLGWSAYIGAAALDYSNTTSNSGTRIVNSNAGGNPSTTTGYVAFQNADGTANTFALLKTGLSLGTPGAITWRNNANAASNSVQILVQLDGGNWFASTQKITPAVGDGTAFQSVAASSFSFTPAASAWTSFNLTAGSSMSVIGTALATDLSFSNITGIGFYVTTPGNAVLRLDTLELNYSSIPEPGTAALLAGAVVLAAASAARRRRI